MAIGNGQLMQECFPKHSSRGTARIKLGKETEEKGKKRGMSIERSEAMKKKSQQPITTPSKYNNNKLNMAAF